MEQFLKILVLLLCVQLSSCSKVFSWTHNAEAYNSDGKVLKGHVVAEFSSKYLVSQCALSCFQDSRCKSFNFVKENKRCQLNNATHEEFPDHVHNSPECQYHLRQAFSVDQGALGLCHLKPCQNGGSCYETKFNSPDVIARCLCANGWTGESCESEDLVSWSPWQEWGACSVSVGRGWYMRHRTCILQDTGSRTSSHLCGGSDVEYETCTESSVPKWAEWLEWGDCSSQHTCGRGLTTRTRLCLTEESFCFAPNQTEIRPCYSIGCNSFGRLVNGTHYGEGRIELFNDITQEWGLVCNDVWNVRASEILCRQLGYVGASEAATANEFGSGEGNFGISNLDCTEDAIRVLQCEHNKWNIPETCAGDQIAAGVKCKVNGIWSMWSSWSNCSVTCGRGEIERQRGCDFPPAANGGTDCPGDNRQVKECVLGVCPGNAAWLEWGSWNVCDKSCGGGVERRTRDCENVQVGCTGDDEETKLCNEDSCPVDGVFTAWSEWDMCTLSCGNGTQGRNRSCDGPHYGGKDCEGDLKEMQSCNTMECPVDGILTSWSNWDTCTLSCGNGTQTRNRTCDGPQYGGRDCEGELSQSQLCNAQECPEDGEWMNWSQWLACNATCGDGSRSRNRTCNGPFHGGRDCEGPAEEENSCNEKPCPLYGEWFSWNEWSLCSVTCGGGSRSRNRTCDMEVHGNLTVDCFGTSDETEECHSFPCSPLLPSCTALGEVGFHDSVYVEIDPDGEGQLEPLTVLCNMKGEGGVGMTVFEHNSQEREQLAENDASMRFTVDVVYQNVTSQTQIEYVVDQSAECSQFLKWECLASVMHKVNDNSVLTTFWSNRYGQPADYFPGAEPGSSMCACGATGTCTHTKKPVVCECDNNDGILRSDFGNITRRADLPVTMFTAGDTEQSPEKGYLTIGPLMCWGKI